MKKFLFGILPKNHLSALFGLLSRVPLPKVIRIPIFALYSKVYGVCGEEAEFPLSTYNSLADFFLRSLKDGRRPIGNDLVSPVDGNLTQQGQIHSGTLLQAKGKEYSLESLLGSLEIASRFEGGYYFTFYLAPGDYHHIHSPISGEITKAVHVQGSLWPVNEWSVNAVPNLFTINERISTLIESETGSIAVVKVGACNVGSISLEYAPIRGNEPLRWFAKAKTHTLAIEPSQAILKGERLGSFRLGSTVILVVSAGMYSGTPPCSPGAIRYGVSLSEGR